MSTTEIIELVIITVLGAAILFYWIYVALKNHWLSQIIETVKQAMIEAEEKWPYGHGEEKKQYVLDAIKEKCESLQIPYSLIVTTISKIITEIVSHWNLLKK